MSIPPRVVEHTTGRKFAFELPHNALRATLAGMEAASIGWVVMVVCAIGAYVATAAEAALGTASWLDAAKVGTNIWLLGHGGVMQFNEATLSVIPWGIAALAILLLRGTVRRSHVDSPWSLAWVCGGYLTVQILAIALGANNSWAALGGSFLVVVIGSLWGIQKDWPWHQKLSSHMPSFVSAGLRAGSWLAAALIAIAALATAVSLVSRSEEATAVHNALSSDPVSSTLLVAGQLLLVGPVLVGWALSFISGKGFSVGEGTIFSPGLVESGPLPALPILAALPADVPATLSTWLVVLLLGSGAGFGLWIHRHRFTLLRALAAMLIVVLCNIVVLATLVAASSGSIGPGTMAVTGAPAFPTAWSLGWKILAGGSAAVLLSHPTTQAKTKQFAAWLRVWWREMRGTNQPTPAAQPTKAQTTKD